jgi:hypothetical protein
VLQPGSGAIKNEPCAAVLRPLELCFLLQRFVNTRVGNFTINHRVARVKMHRLFRLRLESIMIGSRTTCFTLKSATEVIKLNIKIIYLNM